MNGYGEGVIYDGILINHEKYIYAICNNIDGPEEYKDETYDYPYRWKLICKTNEKTK